MGKIAEQITREVASWNGVTVSPHRFGGTEFRFGRFELGHIHNDNQADLLFPNRIRRELVAAGRASPHHLLPETGWTTYYLQSEKDVPQVIELFRLNYKRLKRNT